MLDLAPRCCVSQACPAVWPSVSSVPQNGAQKIGLLWLTTRCPLVSDEKIALQDGMQYVGPEEANKRAAHTSFLVST